MALHLEHHPHVCMYRRGDTSEAFAQACDLHAPFGTSFGTDQNLFLCRDYNLLYLHVRLVDLAEV